MMKTTIERLEGDKLRLDVEVPGNIVQEALDHTLVMMGRDIRMPGFRPGKVPPQAVLARVGREAAIAQAIDHHLDDWYRSAVAASGIRPVAAPEIDFEGGPEGLEEGKALRFSATVEVAPKPKLPDLAQLEVERPKVPDTAEYEQQVLDATLRGAGTLVDAGRPAEPGDEVVVDFSCTVDGEQVRGASATGYEARLGDGRLLGELEEAIGGKEAGTEFEVPVDFPADHPMGDLAGKNATFHVNLREVKTLEAPELDDDVAKQVSEFDTAQQLRDAIRHSIEERLSGEIDGIFRGNAVNKLAQEAEVVPPPVMVERRQQEMYMQLKQQLEQMGMSIEQYLSMQGKDQTELFADLEGEAASDVRRELSLLALAEEQDLSISEEDLRAEVRNHVDQDGTDVDEVVERIVSSGRADMLRGELLMQRAIDYLVGQVTSVEVDVPTADAASADAAASAAEGGE